MSNQLRRVLGLLLLSGVSMGSIIGSGIFSTPGLLASVAGPSAVLAVLLMGFLTLVLGLIYAELGSMLPRAGGIYYFPREVLGDFAGFITGWGYYISCVVGTAAIVYAFVLYLSFYIPWLASGLTLTPHGVAVALAILAVVTYANVRGVRVGAGVSLALTVAKILALAAVALALLSSFKPQNFTPVAPFGLQGVALAIAFGFWMYAGVESVTLVGEEVRDPDRNILRGLLLTVLLVTLVYVLVFTSFVGSIDWARLGLKEGDWGSLANLSSPLADLAGALGLEPVAHLAFIGASLSTLGCFSAWVLLQGRVAFALARESRLWGRLAEIHGKYGTPANAIVFSSALTGLVMLAVPSFPNVVLLSMMASFLAYATGSLSLPVSRKTMLDRNRPFAAPAPLLLGWVGFVFATLYMYWACWPWTLTGSLLMLLGVPVYLAYSKPEGRAREALWLPAYIALVPLFSLLGDKTFTYNNFLPIEPLGILATPLDALALVAVASAFYAIGYYSAVKSSRKTA
ncbi:amino acid permease [Infirmifilum lucidum]|uniref:Amino acid permease n=1 Tax=Infirmifilum lucidum TaxID=2776706 RepID=A0A7L9FGE3_9CREN|nr:APC family permease [Infirmifilum lucidum]QOJ78777.1 amino acid permease [Infirmifilum lucidum]